MNAQARGAMTFGSKEWNAYYHGRNKDGKRAKGDTAKRANTALKKSLTKKAETEELNRRRGEFEAEGAKLAKAQQAEDRATARILGSGAHALKLTKPQGNFTAEDVQAFQRQGWSVHPAGTAPAKVGSSLPAKEAFRLNPSADPLVKILGPGLEARAVVIASPEAMTEDTMEAWRRAGYDVSAAPKKFRQGTKVNPTGAEQRKLYEALRKAHGAPRSVEELAEAAKVPPAEALAGLTRLEALGLAHPSGRSLFGPLWAPGAPSRGLFAEVNPGTGALTGRKLALAKCRIAGYHGNQGDWVRAYTEGRISRRAADEAWSQGQQERARGVGCTCFECAPKAWRNPAPATSGVKARQGAPERGTSKKRPVQAGSMPVSRLKPKAPKANPTKATETAREALEQAWERWTGAKVGASLSLTLPDRGDCPASVVMLGRVSELIAPTGDVKAFGDTGPFMVTDGRMKRVWLIDGKGKRFDLDLTRGLIAYLAKKPKFGDRAPVKYVHHFAGKAHAAMSGHVGELTGTFRLTPRGIEG